ncbi:hypothetical protein BLOT_012381 [Blomia tropicalis]|nr:hypothetical protein BLOT_012381 [Blomia tropicalis]
MSNYNCDSSDLRSSLLINIKDIYNIKKQYKIEDLADQDHRVFIKSMMSIVLDYKEIGEARSDFHTDDFFIIIMSESQQRMMINNSDIISMDLTHDSSIKGLLLTTIMCRDKKRTTYFPCERLLPPSNFWGRNSRNALMRESNN